MGQGGNPTGTLDGPWADVALFFEGEVFVPSPTTQSMSEFGIERSSLAKASHERGMKGRGGSKVLVQHDEPPPGISMTELARNGFKDGLG